MSASSAEAKNEKIQSDKVSKRAENSSSRRKKLDTTGIRTPFSCFREKAIWDIKTNFNKGGHPVRFVIFVQVLINALTKKRMPQLYHAS